MLIRDLVLNSLVKTTNISHPTMQFNIIRYYITAEDDVMSQGESFTIEKGDNGVRSLP